MKVHELLSDESKWIKNDLAVNNKNQSVDYNSPYACKWCVMGGILKCYPEFPNRHKVLARLHDKTLESSTGTWNDNSTYQEVITVLKELDI